MTPIPVPDDIKKRTRDRLEVVRAVKVAYEARRLFMVFQGVAVTPWEGATDMMQDFCKELVLIVADNPAWTLCQVWSTLATSRPTLEPWHNVTPIERGGLKIMVEMTNAIMHRA